MIQLNWKAYFEEFCNVHGDPVQHAGKLLFADGWTYSKTDYAGPEWPPPADVAELRLLHVTYWLKRRRLVQEELRILEQDVFALEEMQRVRHIPLQCVVQEESEDGELRSEIKELDLSMLKERIVWLRGDRDSCDAQLTEMERAASALTA